MSVRRFSLAAAVFLALAVAVAFAQPQVTVVLSNGQSYSGSLVYRNNNVGLITNSGVRSFPTRSVAVIEFVPGQPDPAELSQISSNQGGFLGRGTTGTVLVLQDGQVINGTQASISNDGNMITIVTPDNQRNNYSVNDVARLYLNPSAARNLMASNQNYNQSPFGAVGTTGQMQSGRTMSLTIPGNRKWTPTGIMVHQGDQLAFRAAGRLKWGPGPSDVAGPEGGTAISPNYPVSTAGAGALIGRVGNSQPFLIPSNGETLTMPADGELQLGINDDIVSDNSGSYQVQIAHVGG